MGQISDLDLTGAAGLPRGLDEDPDIHVECVRLVQRPHAEGRFAIGLLPADDDVAVPPVALHIAWALARLTRRPVGLVDANVHYPAFPLARRASSGELESSSGPATRRSRLVTPIEPALHDSNEELLFVERRLDDRITVLCPRSAGEAGAGVPQLELIVARYVDRFAHLVVDLTGFERLGDHLNAAALLDGLIIIARARASRQSDLLRLKSQLPADRTLGVLLLQ